MTETPLCGSERKDTLGFIRGYIKQAYLAQTGKNRPSGSKPYDDISVMAKFWRNFFLQQDSTLICLEIEQRILFFD